MAELDVQRRTVAGATALAFSGRLSVYSAPHIREHLLAAVAEPGARLVLDLTNLDFMDTGGLAALIETQKHARGNGAQLVLFGLQPRVAQAFSMCSAGALFTIVKSEGEVAEAFA